MSRNAILWFIPVMGFLGCQSVDEDVADVADAADAADAEDAEEEPSAAEDPDGIDEDVDAPVEAAQSPSMAPATPGTLLVAPVAVWSYLPQPSCVDVYPAGWTSLEFDDSDWPSGPAELGYGDGDEQTVMPPGGPDAAHKCATQLFRHKFTVGDPALYETLVLHLLRDDGAAVYLNGTQIKRHNLPAVLGMSKFATTEVSGTAEDEFFVFSGLANTLKAGENKNILAVEVHQRSKTNPDLSFNLALLGMLTPDPTHATRSFSSAEATIDEFEPTKQFGSASTCQIDGASGVNGTEGQTACLAKWDLSNAGTGIPLGSTVLAAHLVTDVENASSDRYQVYDVTTPWSEPKATWNDSDTSKPGTVDDWQTPAPGGHFGENDLAVGPDLTPWTVVNAIKTGGGKIYALPPALVQLWVGTYKPGLAVVDPLGAVLNSNGLYFNASGKGLELVVTYAPPPPPPPSGYDAIPDTLPKSLPSQGFECCQTNEYGDEVKLGGTLRTPQSMTAVLVSWGCEKRLGEAKVCDTTPGSTFTVPITFTIYADKNGTKGDVLAQKTEDVNVLYRPSASPNHCTEGKWYDADADKCYNGLTQTVEMTFLMGTTLPDNVIWTVAYDTSHAGHNPIGEAPECYSTPAGCGYDSLNVGAFSADGAPYVGTDIEETKVFTNEAMKTEDPGYRPLGAIKTKL